MDFKVFVEINAGGNIKYEIDKKTGKLEVDRFLHTSFVYPFNYGFIPDTHADDGDAVDVIVLSSQPVMPGATIKCHAIGMLQMEDEEGLDEKIIAVPDVKVDPEYGPYTNVKDVPGPTLKKIQHFFEHYKGLEPGKWVKIGGFEDKDVAESYIKKSGTKK